MGDLSVSLSPLNTFNQQVLVSKPRSLLPSPAKDRECRQNRRKKPSPNVRCVARQLQLLLAPPHFTRCTFTPPPPPLPSRYPSHQPARSPFSAPFYPARHKGRRHCPANDKLEHSDADILFRRLVRTAPGRGGNAMANIPAGPALRSLALRTASTLRVRARLSSLQLSSNELCTS